MNFELISIVFVAAVFVGAVVVGYSRFLRRHHFAILLTVLASWVVGLLISPFAAEYVGRGNQTLIGWLIVSAVAAPLGLIGWSLGYISRELFPRLRSRHRHRLRRLRSSPQK